ncbi:MAG: thioredoxin family protein [Sphingomonadales bacterium]|nr:MAG: thioredoxin family protein [Sphingomonadales bacterium]
MIRRLGWLWALLALSAPAQALAPERAPRLAAATRDLLPSPLPQPYSASADARAEVRAARARSKKSGKPVLLDFGANWCINCRVFAAVIELPEMRGWMARHFEVVTIDVGQVDRNLDIAAFYGVPQLRAVPALLVIDPATGALLNKSEVTAIGGTAGVTPQQMANWLARWTR